MRRIALAAVFLLLGGASMAVAPALAAAQSGYSVTPTQAGAAVNMTTTTLGNADITFRGTTGERIFIQASSWNYTGVAYLTITNPDGSTFVSDVAFDGNGDLGYYDMGESALPQTGTYTAIWDPPSTGSVTLTFYKVPADASYSVTPSKAGAAKPVSTRTPGQNANTTFSGSAGGADLHPGVQLGLHRPGLPDDHEPGREHVRLRRVLRRQRRPRLLRHGSRRCRRPARTRSCGTRTRTRPAVSP